MTDAEIKKALECCANYGLLKCNKCPMRNGSKTCMYDLSKLTIDLINRQQAEIEELTAAKKTYENIIKNSFFEAAGVDIDPLAEIKAEAIKELMLNLDGEISTYISNGKDLNVYAWLKDYTKKMVGDAE